MRTMFRWPWLVILLTAPCTLNAQDGPTTWMRHVSRLEPAVAHYQAVGFRVKLREDTRVSFAQRGGVVLVLSTDPASDPLAAERAMVIPITDLASVRSDIRSADVPHQLLVARPSGIGSLLVLDPDGYRTILRPARDIGQTAIPGPEELNPLVMEVLAGFPADGTHRYHWPKKGSWKGNIEDLVYDGVVFAPGDPEGRCFCCGLTFEVLLDAWRLWCARNGRPWRIADLDLDGVRKLQTQWFGSSRDKSCLHTALVDNDLGFRVTDWDDARAGDFVQLWRASGSGHSVVFLSWLRAADDADGRIVGIRYWSTQGATKGIGERVESFEEDAGERRVLRDPLWLCRVGVRRVPAERGTF